MKWTWREEAAHIVAGVIRCGLVGAGLALLFGAPILPVVAISAGGSIPLGMLRRRKERHEELLP